MSKAIIQIGRTEALASGRQLIHAVLGGTVGHNDIEQVAAWATELHAAVAKLAGQENQSVSILIDIGRLEAYTDPAVIRVLIELMRQDSPYVYRTATFGGTALHEMIQGVIRNLSGRNNLQNFKTEAEARAWLEA